MNRTVGSDPETPRIILVAEDHPDSRDALKTLLEAMGYGVRLAADGREAVSEALAAQPDLILMDIMMPEVDGLEATQQLRKAEGFRQVPIVALTAMEGARDRALAAGCDDYVTKPIDLPAFFSKIQHWLIAGHPAA